MEKAIQGFPASSQQEHLYLLQQADDSLAYRVQCAILIEGKLDPNLLKRALREVINRHEILHTTLQYLPGMTPLVQILNDSSSLSIEEIELSGWSLSSQEAEASRRFDELERKPFAFESGTPLHLQLLRFSDEKHILLISISALCADATTLKNLLHELCHIYASYLGHQEIGEGPLQYADFAQWQCEILESEEAMPAKQYWQMNDLSNLSGLDLPFRNLIGKRHSFEPKTLLLAIDTELTANVVAVARKYESTTPAVLLSVWVVHLWRLTGRSDIVVGAVCDGRKYTELETALGPFTRYLPVLCQPQAGDRFVDVLARIRQSLEDNYRMQEGFSWEQVAKSEARDGGEPFCCMSFDFTNEPPSHFAAGVSFSISKQYQCFERFEIKLSCVEGQHSLTSQIHFDPDLFQEEDLRRLGKQFHRLLESATANPYALITELVILDDSAQHQILVEWNNTQHESRSEGGVHRMIERQAADRPDTVAVGGEGRWLSYRELNRRANQLAHYLQRIGVRRGDLVGVCLEHGLEEVLGLLGVLKAGAGYVPLDPAHPVERMARMLSDAQVSVLLTEERLRAGLQSLRPGLLSLDSDWALVSAESDAAVEGWECRADIAYLIYTSGSTGEPKGVAISHEALVNYIEWAKAVYLEGENLSFGLYSSIAFDLTVTSIYTPLISGSAVMVYPRQGKEPPLERMLSEGEVGVLKLTPSHLSMIKERDNRGSGVKCLIVGGEAFEEKLAREVWESFGGEVKIYNEYGPTEATVGCMIYKYEADERQRAMVPIGHPSDNTRIYLLDPLYHPVPIGIDGELHVGGVNISRGYLNRPDSTAERFIPNPFGVNAGARLYRTGDLARYKPDGDVEFLGRRDNQVKIRGYRIELGEIEALLNQHPAVEQVAVLAEEALTGRRQLVAYWVGVEEVSGDDLRKYLEERLPDYMTPTAFVQVECMPLTPNGKLDRQALLKQRVNVESQTYVAPRNAVEESLCRIWADVLGVEQLGIEDNFFKRGGDSILSIQIIFKAKQAGYVLSPRDIFQHQTIAGLASVINTNQIVMAEQGAVCGPVPLTPIQHWFFEQDLDYAHHWNQALLLSVPADLNATVLENALRHLLWHHDVLRHRFIREGSSWHQISVEPEDAVPFMQEDLSALPRPEQRAALEDIAAELQASLNLSEGPLMRVALFKLGAQKPGQLLIVIHHLIVDVFSWGILLHDLQTAYEQLSLDQAIALPAKTTSYQQWARRLMEYARSADLIQDMGYWLAGHYTEISRLPVDYSKGINSEASARTVRAWLNQEETEALLREVPNAYQMQINEVLLTALVLAFAPWTGSCQLLIDLEGHGREQLFQELDLSRTVGWFTTICPLLLHLADFTETGVALKRIKEQVRSLPQHGMGYGLMRYLSGNSEIAEQLRARPQPEISFNYLGQLDRALSWLPLFKFTWESCGPSTNPRAARKYLLEVICRVEEQQFQFALRYSENLHRTETIEQLTRNFMAALRSIISHCQTEGAGGYTPSDFPEAELDQEELDKLMAELS
jgi:amino acid adenylation domain-containing protein/non-ribosomal peptide synthase protein (TIGR01720 family)